MTMHVSNLRLYVFYVIDSVYAREFGHQRFHSLRFALCLVQTTGIEVADLLFVATLDGVSLLRRFFQNLVQRLAVILRKNIEAAPRGIGPGYFSVLEPRAVRILIKVGAR